MSARQSLNNSTVRIGCSGWQYKHWRGDFYPADLPTEGWLRFYASRFDTVEINNSFYRLPEASVFAAWRRRVPSGFLYAVKASRFLTHMKKLKDPAEPVERFFSRARRLGTSLGPVLYQLPPRWPVNIDRLSTFLEHLPRRRRHAIEFRDPSWYSARPSRPSRMFGWLKPNVSPPGCANASPRPALRVWSWDFPAASIRPSSRACRSLPRQAPSSAS